MCGILNSSKNKHTNCKTIACLIVIICLFNYLPMQQYIHFKGLNPLRFFAALSIILYHTYLPFLDRLPKDLKSLVHNFPIGVDFFFLISGFLITYLLVVEKQQTQSINLFKFYTRRALRIFPLYFFIVGIAFFLHHKTNPEIDFGKYLYFWGNFWMISTDKWTIGMLNPLWSLCIEEHFYLFVPLLVSIVPNNKLKYLFIGIISLSIGFKAAVTIIYPYNWMTIYCHTLSRCDVLALGGLIAYYHHQNKIVIPNWSPYFLYFGLSYLFILLCIVDFSDYSTVLSASIKKYLFVAPLLFLFLYVLFVDNKLTIWLKNNAILNYLGKISYGLYMYHSLVGDFIARYNFINTSIVLRLVFMLFFTIFISALSYELFEKQFLKLKTSFETVKTKN